LSKKKDFESIFKNGVFFSGPGMSLRAKKNDLAYSRFAVVTSLKVSKKAVERNRLRRQITEVLRKRFDRIGKGFDAVFIVKKDLLEKKYGQIETEVEKILKKARIL
jgi:ribonuclease P protein component